MKRHVAHDPCCTVFCFLRTKASSSQTRGGVNIDKSPFAKNGIEKKKRPQKSNKNKLKHYSQEWVKGIKCTTKTIVRNTVEIYTFRSMCPKVHLLGFCPVVITYFPSVHNYISHFRVTKYVTFFVSRKYVTFLVHH